MGLSLSRPTAGAVLVLACLTLAPARAWADESAAEALFQEGLAAMTRKDYPVACEAFAGSNKADPSPGTQINLAVCFEKQQKWASAWTWYRSSVGLAQQRGQSDREKLADDAATRVKPLIHYVTVSVKEPLKDLTVKRDGNEVTIALAGKDVLLPVDPGAHTFEVAAPGKKAWKKVVHIADNPSVESIDVPKLEDASVEALGGAELDSRPPAGVVTSDGSSQRTVGVVVGSAGLLSALAGIGVFILAKNEDSEANKKRAQAVDTSTSLSVADRKALSDSANTNSKAAKNDRLIAIVLGSGAVVLVGVGAALYLTAPKRAEKSGKPQVLPLLGPGFAGLGLNGTF